MHDMRAKAPAIQADGSYDIGDVIDRIPVSAVQKLTVALCCLVGLLDGFDAQSIGFLAPPIAAALGTDMKAFGPMFSASLVGLMLSSLVMGPIGDTWGRKKTLILATLTFGVFALLTAFVQSLEQLIALRFLTGLGLGGAIPSLFALVTDAMPKRLHAISACLASAAFPTGGMVAGLLTSWLLPRWGWQSVFYVGGIAPIVVALIIAIALPESVRFLALRRQASDKVRAIMERIWKDARGKSYRFSSREETSASVPVVDLFRKGRSAVTVLLWLSYFMNLMVIYFIVSWMPALLKEASLPVEAGIVAITTFSIGGIVGSLAQGPAMARWAPRAVFLPEFATFVVLALTLALAPLSIPLVGTFGFVIGVVIQGAQAGFNGFAASFYPTATRSTGVAWALGIGRVGSIVGPILGGWALQSGWTPRMIFAAGSIPALCAAAAIALVVTSARTDAASKAN